MRYSRQELVIGKKSQLLLSKSKACIVGMGALGTFSAELLARAGVGNLKLIDRDIVELHNLQRQSLYTESDIGQPKGLAAKKHLEEINSEIEIEAFSEDLNSKNIKLLDSDIVLDCTDNLATRFLVNDYCAKNKLSWIYSAVIGTLGRVMVILPGKYCFRCYVKDAKGLGTCDTVGVLNTAVAMNSSIQVSEAIKILTKNKPSLGLICINSAANEIKVVNAKKNKDCPCCSKGKYEYLIKKEEGIIKFCGSGTYQIKGDFDFKEVKKRLLKSNAITDFGSSFSFDGISVFNNRVLIKAKDEKEAKAIYSKYIGN